MKRVVVSTSLNGRPSAISCHAVMAKLSWMFCTSLLKMSSPGVAAKSKPPLVSSCGLKSSAGLKPDCWNVLRKNDSIRSRYRPCSVGSAVHPSMSVRNPCAPCAVASATSSSVGVMPVSRFFTLRTLDAAVAASKGGGGGVVEPESPPAPAPEPPPPLDGARAAPI